MRVGIMQPYFFPYIGYFQLMAAVDWWIVFDTPQYIRHGWVNRNRVLTESADNWKYITVPTQKAPRETPISDIQIATGSRWRDDLLNAMEFYRLNRAPYYVPTIQFLRQCLQVESTSLSTMLIQSLKSACDYVGLRIPRFDVFSQMNLSLGPVAHAGEWALRICEQVGASAYLNPPGGREIFVPEDFARSGINLQFLDPVLQPYKQGIRPFVPGLSIVDLLMWNSTSDVCAMAKQIKLLK